MSAVRSFSTQSVQMRSWDRITRSHKVAKVPDYVVGGVRPAIVPASRATVPAYPYGELPFFKRMNRGLYGGKFPLNQEQELEMRNKSLRKRNLNEQTTRLWLTALGKSIRVPTTTKVMRTISKEGGLDNYLLKDKLARIKELGPYGWELRYQVLKALNDATKVEEPLPQLRYRSQTYNVYAVRDGVKVVCGKRRLINHLYNMPLETKKVSPAQFRIEWYPKLLEEVLAELERRGFEWSKAGAAAKFAELQVGFQKYSRNLREQQLRAAEKREKREAAKTKAIEELRNRVFVSPEMS